MALVLWSISDPFGSSALERRCYRYGARLLFFPQGPDEPNGSGGVCSGCVDTDDVRITGQVKYNAGTLWGSLNTGISSSTEAGPIWFEVHPILDTNGNITAAEERQEDCFVCNGWPATAPLTMLTCSLIPKATWSWSLNIRPTPFTERGLHQSPGYLRRQPDGW